MLAFSMLMLGCFDGLKLMLIVVFDKIAVGLLNLCNLMIANFYCC